MAVDRTRLDDLLLARATEGLDAEDAAELARLLAAEPAADDGGYERAAAAICLAALRNPESMPGRVRARLEGLVNRGGGRSR
jgi:hypothetical protein